MASAWDAWSRFWFAPQPTSTLALIRIGYGLIVVGWTVTLAPGVVDMFSHDGILPAPPADRLPNQESMWGVLDISDSPTAVWVVWVALLIAGICVTLGLFSQFAALVCWLIILSLERRNPFMHNAGDVLLRIVGLYLVFAPIGASLSLDRLRRHRERFWTFPSHAPIVIRLLQIQVSLIYVSTVWAKVRGEAWNNGSAVAYSLNLDDLARVPVPDFILESALLVNIATWTVLAVELSIGIFVWNRRLRPYVLLAGVGLHVAIDINITIGFFSWTVLLLYVAFVPPDRASTLIVSVRDLLTGRRKWTDVRLLPLRSQRTVVPETGEGSTP
jgi:uncharacterized membrane protein YphA (DoxX/SURF4 family)